MQWILKIALAILFWAVFIYLVFKVDYPRSLTQASLLQLFSFFIPLYFALTFTINLILRSMLSAISVSLGLILLLVLKGLDSLNIVSGGITTITVFLLVSYFKGSKQSLTYLKNMPKLRSLSKTTNRSKLKNLRKRKR